jgi:large subunit ribosomal protein L30e
MDFTKELNRTVSSGKVYFGRKEAFRRCNEAKMFIISHDCPEKKEIIEQSNNVPVYIYNGSSRTLGTLLKKPFSISVVTIIDAGASNIMDLGK